MDDHWQALTERMTKSERDQSFPDSVPRDAATMMLIDRAGPDPKVLLGRRHASHKFMPGKFVFPGGRIEEADAKMAAATELASGGRAQSSALRPRDAEVPPAARLSARRHPRNLRRDRPDARQEGRQAPHRAK